PCAARRDPEVEVRQVDEPQALELRRQAGNRHVDAAQAHPAGLEPAPRERRQAEPGEHGEDEEHGHGAAVTVEPGAGPGLRLPGPVSVLRLRRSVLQESAAPALPPLRTVRRACAGNLRWPLDLELLEDRRDRHDVPLDLELRLLESGGDADELREVEDRQAVLAPGRLLELLLPGVEREV